MSKIFRGFDPGNPPPLNTALLILLKKTVRRGVACGITSLECLSLSGAALAASSGLSDSLASTSLTFVAHSNLQ